MKPFNIKMHKSYKKSVQEVGNEIGPIVGPTNVWQRTLQEIASAT